LSKSLGLPIIWLGFNLEHNKNNLHYQVCKQSEEQREFKIKPTCWNCNI